MARSLINGTEQIAAGTIPLSALVSGYSIPTANLVDGANFIIKTGTVAFTADQSMGSHKITSLANGTAGTDAVNLSQLQGAIAGFTIHGARLVASANVTLSGEQTIDGVTTSASRVMLKGQTTASQNGIWITAAGAWTRPTDWPAAGTLTEGQYVYIDNEGTTFAATKWYTTNTAAIVVDTTSVSFQQDVGTNYTNGTGLSLTGNTFAVLYGTSSTTAAVGNDARITGALQTSALGTGVQTALGVNVGSAGAFVVLGGALGTPSSGTLTNATGLPVSTGISGLGTGVATALAINAGTGAGFALLSSGVLAAAEFPALTGDVTTAGGALATTINHTAGTGFMKYTDEVANETPGGLVNGTNTAYTLANTPATVNGGVSSVMLFLNGQVLEEGSGNDFTRVTTAITMLFAPATGDKLRAWYCK